MYSGSMSVKGTEWSGLHVVSCKDCGEQSVDCPMFSVGCQMQSVECKMNSVGCTVWGVELECEMWGGGSGV